MYKRQVRLRVHTGDPGTTGADNRVPIYLDIPPGNFQLMGARYTKIGETTNTTIINVGELSATEDITVTHFSFYTVDDEFLGWVSLTQGVTIEAEDILRLGPGAIRFKIT